MPRADAARSALRGERRLLQAQTYGILMRARVGGAEFHRRRADDFTRMQNMFAQEVFKHFALFARFDIRCMPRRIPRCKR